MVAILNLHRNNCILLVVAGDLYPQGVFRWLCHRNTPSHSPDFRAEGAKIGTER